MKTGFGVLFKRELRSSIGSLILLLVLVVIWDLFLLSRQNSWEKTLVFFLSFLPMVFLPFYALVSGFQMLREEWRKKTINQFLASPRGGVTFTSVKLLTVWVEAIIFIIAVFIGGVFFGRTVLPEPIPVHVFVQYGLVLSVFTVIITVLSQFAYLVGRVFQRFRWLMSFWVFLLSAWGIARLSGSVAFIFSFVPNIQLSGWFLSGIWHYLGETSTPQPIKIHGPTVTVILLSVFLIFLLGSWILEKHVELPSGE